MNESNLKAPTKKAFHFPKGESANAANEGSVTLVTPEPVKRTRAPSKKKEAAVAVGETSATAAAPAAPKKAAARKATVKKAVAQKPAAQKPAAQKPAAQKPAAEKAAAGKPASRKSSPKKSAVTKDAAAPKADAAPVEKVKREKKEKVVRDSFTMPKSDYAKIAVLKQKCLDAGVHVKKSELLRAGLALLEGVSEKRLAAVLADLETVKTGRPAND